MLFKDVNDSKCVLYPNPNFAYDEACLDVINTLNDPIAIWGQYTECHNCDHQNLSTMEPHQNSSFLINTRYPIQLYYVVNNTDMCSLTKLLYERYRYVWNISTTCSKPYIKGPAVATGTAYFPIFTAFIVLFCFGHLWYMIIRQFAFWSKEIESDVGGSPAETPLKIESTPTICKHSHRIKSIDVFRGFCVVLMIFVNYGGGHYWFFEHSVWNGITIADLVYPWFLWLMGISFSVSLQAKLKRGVPSRQLVVEVVRRSLILILLGIIINSHKILPTIAELRFPGILQRIAVSYFIVGILEIAFAKRSKMDITVSHVHDIATAWAQWLFVITLVLIHTYITFLINVPGCGKGYLGPGGLDNGGRYYNCTGGAAAYIDRIVFGEHIYKYGYAQLKKVYEAEAHYDSDGLLGTLTSVLMVYLGVQAGRTLNTYQNVKAKVIRWLVWGLFTGLLGGALCEFRKDDGLIPLNRYLLSLSLALVASGMAFVIQSFLFVVVDIMKKWSGGPFFYPGMNSIILFLCHELFRNTFPWAWTPVCETHGVYMCMHLWGTMLWFAFSKFLYKRNIFFAL